MTLSFSVVLASFVGKLGFHGRACTSAPSCSRVHVPAAADFPQHDVAVPRLIVKQAAPIHFTATPRADSASQGNTWLTQSLSSLEVVMTVSLKPFSMKKLC